MPLPVAVTRIPTTIGQIYLEFVDEDGSQNTRQARFMVEVFDQLGEGMNGARGNLVQHLEPADITYLLDLQDRMRAKAVAEIIP